MSRAEGTPSEAPPPPSGDRAYATGDRCEKYRIVKLLGEGGMGQVYVAEDDYLRRRVALKVVRRKYMQGGSFAQGQRKEARVLAELDHPNIVKVYDAGITRGGVMYIVMELIDGISLRELIRRLGALDVPSALSITAQIADAVRVAHRAGIVHRDLKPENALVTRAGQVKVVDFGIAKRIRRHPEGPTSTDPFANIGTVHYMAPEQALGDGATKASDVYAIGMILYELIAGRHTFAASSREMPTRGEVMLHQVHAVPRPLVEAVPGFDAREISDLVERMLSKIPRERPRAAEVQRALGREVRRRREEHPYEEARFSLAPQHRRDAPIAPLPRGGRASMAELGAGAGDGPESGSGRAAWPGSDEAPPGPQLVTAPLDGAFRPPEAALPFQPTGAAPPVLRGRGWTMRMHGAPGGPGPAATTAAGAPLPSEGAAGLPAARSPLNPRQVITQRMLPVAVPPATAPLAGHNGVPASAAGPATQAGPATAPLGGYAGARASGPPSLAAPAGSSASRPAGLDPPPAASMRPAELAVPSSASTPPIGFGPPPDAGPRAVGIGLPRGTALRPVGLGPRPAGRRMRAWQWLAVSVASLLTSGLATAIVLAWWSSRDAATPETAVLGPLPAERETADPPGAAASADLSAAGASAPAAVSASASAAAGASASAAVSASASAAPIPEPGSPEEPAPPSAAVPVLAGVPDPASAASTRSAVAAQTPRPAAAAPKPRATETSGSPWDKPIFSDEDDDFYGMPAPDRRRAVPAPSARKAPSRPF
ncbi:protein kinase [Sorangium sp. So ce590]|uniref:serine/threonine-protein kinase n=1 Tax=Sorangium sp. So ce590 TaxID=3133317 RepID=UPI003F61D26C